MIQRTVSAKVAEGKPAAPVELPRWEARDEWGTQVVLSGHGDDPDTIGKWFRAADAFTAAELAAEHLVERGFLDGPTVIEVRCVCQSRPGEWHRVAVDVWLAVEYDVSARGLAPARKPLQLRRSKA